jgi:hypothetical protein
MPSSFDARLGEKLILVWDTIASALRGYQVISNIVGSKVFSQGWSVRLPPGLTADISLVEYYW